MFSLESTEVSLSVVYEKVKHLSSLLFRGAVLSKTGHSSPQATSLQSEVTEVEKDLTLRCLLWESLQEWQGLVDQWEATPFETLKIDEVQKDVTRFIQTVFLLEKGTLVFTLLRLRFFLHSKCYGNVCFNREEKTWLFQVSKIIYTANA